MGILSRRKGKRGEREACAALKEHFDLDFHRTRQSDGSQDPDIKGISGVHFEVKWYKGIAALRFMDQAILDAPDGEIPAVLMRENGSKQWFILTRIQDLPGLADSLRQK